MKRSAFDDEAPAGPPATSTAGKMRPCAECATQVLWETLSLYGGRCQHCYAAYLRGAGQRRLEASDRKQLAASVKAIAAAGEPDKAWAYKLRDREAAGEKLTSAQRQAWRAALPRRALSLSGDAS